MAEHTDQNLLHQVIYSVFVRNHTKEGTFRALEGDLDRLKGLGADIICGPFFVCDTTRSGDFSSLSKSKIAEYSKLFAEVPAFSGTEPELEPRMTFIGFDY